MAVSVDASSRERENHAEAALLSELATGDRDRALEGLYAAYGGQVYRLGLMLRFAAAVDPALYPVLIVTAEPGDGDPRATGPEVLR